MDTSNFKKGLAELLGTFWLTFGGCGSAVLAAAYPELGIGLLGVSLAFRKSGLCALKPPSSAGQMSVELTGPESFHHALWVPPSSPLLPGDKPILT